MADRFHRSCRLTLIDVALNAADVDFRLVAVNGAICPGTPMHIAVSPASSATGHPFAAGGGNKDDFNFWIDFAAQAMHFSTSKLRYGSKSTLLAASAKLRQTYADISAVCLHLGNGKHRHFVFFTEIEAGRATRLPTFSINRIPLSSSGRRGRRRQSSVRQDGSLYRYSPECWCAGSANACGIVHGLLVAFITAHGTLSFRRIKVSVSRVVYRNQGWKPG